VIAELKPYDSTKQTPEDWLGNVPSHWRIEPGFAGLRTKKVKNVGMAESTVLSLSYGRIVIKPIEKLHGLVPESFETYQVVDPGDLIVRSTDLQNDWNSKRIGLVRDRGIITSAYLCFSATPAFSPEYAYLLLHAYDLMKVFYGLGSGLRQNLDWTDFKRLTILLPPPDEQELIVRFLDWASVRLGKAIAAKRKVIGLLEEQKQAIIHRAVTRGLDDSVPLKPSGLDWLGDVPDYVRTVPLKAVCKIQSGITLGKHYGNEQLVEYAYLRVANVQAGRVDLKKVLRLRLPRRDAQRSLLQYGDLLMTEGGDPDKLGRGCIWRNEIEPCIHQNHVFAVRPDPSRVVADFLEVMLSTQYARDYFIRTAKQTTNLASTNRTTIGAFRLLLPESIKQQQEVVDSIRQQLRPVDTSIGRFTNEIELLQEYRTRLIADVVTGKLDVRAFARTLPADVAEEAAELASSELDNEFSDTDDELDDEFAGEPA
jgi:type I restriction enzyme S subunit